MGCVTAKVSRIGKGIKVQFGLVCSVNKKKYLRISPEHIFLMPRNQFKGEVLIMSNVAWKVE